MRPTDPVLKRSRAGTIATPPAIRLPAAEGAAFLRAALQQRRVYVRPLSLSLSLCRVRSCSLSVLSAALKFLLGGSLVRVGALNLIWAFASIIK